MQVTIKGRAKQSGASQSSAVSLAQSLFNCRSQASLLHNSYSMPGFELSTRQPFPSKRKLSCVERTICNGIHALQKVLAHTVPSMTATESAQTGISWGKGPDSGRKSRTHAHSIIQHCIPLTF